VRKFSFQPVLEDLELQIPQSINTLVEKAPISQVQDAKHQESRVTILSAHKPIKFIFIVVKISTIFIWMTVRVKWWGGDFSLI
jgi:hypothetical protein